MDQIVDAVLGLPTLDVLVPQMVEQLSDVFQFFATRLPVVAERVVDVPKISFEDIPTRTPAREPQLAEQLVEVPTILYFLKQTADTPVPHGRGRRLQGFLPKQNPAAQSAEQIVDIQAYAQDRVQQRLRRSPGSPVRECCGAPAHPS